MLCIGCHVSIEGGYAEMAKRALCAGADTFQFFTKNPRGRGQGQIGLDAVKVLLTHPATRNLPFYLETPCDLDGYAEEMKLMRGLAND